MTQRRIDIAKTIITFAGIAITLIGVAIAFGAQNQKLEGTVAEQAKMKERVDAHDISITRLETKVDYIIKGVDEIKAEIKK
jgi:uncharacterized membrane protein